MRAKVESSSQMVKTEVKEEVDDGEEPTDPAEESTTLKEKYCLGCNRGALSGVCFIDRTQPVAWAAAGKRGHWCRDCHCTWRTYWSEGHTLTLFSTWIRQAENHMAFECSLLAFLTLVNEGVGRISEGMIRDRIKMLKWMMMPKILKKKPLAKTLSKQKNTQMSLLNSTWKTPSLKN